MENLIKSESVIYFDNNATTRVADEVIEVMLPFFGEKYGNLSSMHSFGGQVGKSLKIARVQVADLIGASDPQDIIFTSCGTESANMAIRGILEANKTKKHIVTTKVEHPCVFNVAKWLEKKRLSGYLFKCKF